MLIEDLKMSKDFCTHVNILNLCSEINVQRCKCLYVTVVCKICKVAVLCEVKLLWRIDNCV